MNNSTTDNMNDILIAVPMIGNNNWLGGENYIRNILHALATLPAEHRPRIRLTSAMDANEDALNSLTGHDFVSIHPLVRFARKSRASKFLFRVLNRLCRLALGPDSNIEYRNVDFIYPVMTNVPSSTRPIYWIGDFQEIYLPQLFTEEQRKLRHEKNSAIISSPNVLVLSSQSALDDLHKHFGDVNARTVIWRFCSLLHQQVSGGQNPHEAYELPSKFAYIPNQFWAHKNHELAFRALAKLKHELPDLQIVCTGSTYEHRVKGHFEKLENLMKHEGIVDRVQLLGVIPREDQVEVMRHAAFILQPSLFEGWSTVVEDARTLGRPILLSNLPVHLEQDPPHALFFDPYKVDDLVEKLRQAWGKWPPGPDLKGESLATKAAEHRQVEAGREFIGIIRDAIAYRDFKTS